MTTPQLAPPPSDTSHRDQSPPRAPLRAPGVPGARSSVSYGRVLRWSLLVSVVAHILLLVISGPFIRVDPLQSAGRDARDPDSFAGLEWVIPVPEGAEGDSPPAASSETPEPQPVRETPAVVRVRPGSAAPEPTPARPDAAGAPGGRGNARDALRPGYRDPRLYVDPKALGVTGEEKSAHEKYMEHLQARIDAVNDSMGAVAAREKAAKDWTFRDKQGKRWGISDEGLHLGGITVPKELVPVPRSTGDNQTIEAGREEQRQRDEIRRQEETRERRDTLQQRSRAIRERSGNAKKPGGSS